MRTAVCTIIIASLLFSGCFVESTITGSEPTPEDCKVFFYLKDGSTIKSYADHHRRVEGGYEVAGIITPKGGLAKEFTGVLHDADIERISINEFSLGGTVVGALVTAGLVLAVIGLHLSSHMDGL